MSKFCFILNSVALLGLVYCGLTSCNSNEKEAEDILPVEETEIQLTSTTQQRDTFHYQIMDEIDIDKTSLIAGEWKVDSGKMEFLNTILKTGDKVVFKNTPSKVVTGWGTITYNRASKFYFTESGSHAYDYYVDVNGSLNLLNYEYRNDDLSFKEKPSVIRKVLQLEIISPEKLVLRNDQQKATLSK